MVVDVGALLPMSQPLETQQSSMLMPSQIPLKFRKQAQKKTAAAAIPVDNLFVNDANMSLVPSQVSGARQRTAKMGNSKRDGDNSVDEKSKKKTEQTKPKSQPGNNNNRNKKSNNNNKNKNNNKRQKKRHSGNFPDVLWRHIPLEDVRKHPLFVPLPEPESIRHLESMEDVRNFRQESWQWDVLHQGRMTTSQAVAALGFLEPKAGGILGVPKGLRRGGEGAYYRLRAPAVTRTLEEMNARLCEPDDEDDSNKGNKKDKRPCWTQPSNYPFAAKYMVQITEKDCRARKQIASQYVNSQKNHWSIRMVWGNVQEATSLLTALNYFWKHDKNVIMKEVGMCGAGLQFNKTSESLGLILGATPDAVLCHSDGKIEAVEVKNHCPFIPNANRYPKSNNYNATKFKQVDKNAFRLSRQTLSKEDSVMSQYIPQLMMEMLCLGENCESAIMVRQTATHGSLVMRIQRNNEWIDEMIYWLERFYCDFVEKEEPPPRNFFLEGSNPDDQARYKEFLELTKRVQDNVELLEHIPHRSVQRATAKQGVSTSLFLD
eukprot:CAMPEP_0116127438 /NCGR_PEP_ID=MMETSP0329-20121206/6840_1 /TAXON_ID=697910 /ORGANISM="Pseudo-nitzschia arenysensis, Strain B593" /LENGTH=544 /DNA_ID=CAMNT_0003621537 /DNA_START=114 /DNA_END=1748 /DNA_ORIENTATION=+